MDLDLSGKKFFVTGVASGIGHATAELLLRAGAEVVGADRAELSKPLPLAAFHHLDLSDPALIDRAVAAAGDGYDALINVAGVSSLASTDMQFRVNFLGTRHLTLAMVPRLKARSAVFNVASSTAVRWEQHLDRFTPLVETRSFEEGLQWLEANPQESPISYAWSKEALIIWTMKTGLEWIGTGRRINALSPGLTYTPMHAEFVQAHGGALLKKDAERTGDAGSAEDVAKALVLLQHDYAAWWNAANINVDGGFSASVLMAKENFGDV